MTYSGLYRKTEQQQGTNREDSEFSQAEVLQSKRNCLSKNSMLFFVAHLPKKLEIKSCKFAMYPQKTKKLSSGSFHHFCQPIKNHFFITKFFYQEHTFH